MVPPRRPNSSAITAKIESVEASGKNEYFCKDDPSPTPKKPPEPKLKRICLMWYDLPKGSWVICKKVRSLSRRYGEKRIRGIPAAIPAVIAPAMYQMGIP